MTSTSGLTSVVDCGWSMTRLVLAAASAALAIGGTTLTAGAGQKSAQVMQPQVNESMYGPDLYRHYCATCHGRDAKGGGPAAAAMKVPPPDLTVLAQRRNGVFPSVEVESIIRGGTVIIGHGSNNMPVWGPIFRALDTSDAGIKARISSLVSHLASIQQR
jgi:mono/diheme cytochrome c family protein